MGDHLAIVREIHFPHSLGLLYSAFTDYTGFRVNSGEYKRMGLAPSGEPRYQQLIFEHLIDVKPDGSFRLNLVDIAASIQATLDPGHARPSHAPAHPQPAPGVRPKEPVPGRRGSAQLRRQRQNGSLKGCGSNPRPGAPRWP